MTGRIAGLQKEFAGRPEVRFISFSVDPEYDKPEVLAHYAARYGAGQNWRFLTGETGLVHDLIVKGFHLAAQKNEQAKPGEEVSHSLSFVLVDGTGVIRGYYTGNDDEALEKLRRDLRSLIGHA